MLGDGSRRQVQLAVFTKPENVSLGQVGVFLEQGLGTSALPREDRFDNRTVLHLREEQKFVLGLKQIIGAGFNGDSPRGGERQAIVQSQRGDQRGVAGGLR